MATVTLTIEEYNILHDGYIEKQNNDNFEPNCLVCSSLKTHVHLLDEIENLKNDLLLKDAEIERLQNLLPILKEPGLYVLNCGNFKKCNG